MILNNAVNFLNWNARSLKAKEGEFFNFLTVHDVHIAVVTETLLKPNIKLKKNPNFIAHRFDRIDVAGGGVAIVIHRRIKHRVYPILKPKLSRVWELKLKQVLAFYL